VASAARTGGGGLGEGERGGLALRVGVGQVSVCGGGGNEQLTVLVELTKMDVWRRMSEAPSMTRTSVASKAMARARASSHWKMNLGSSPFVQAGAVKSFATSEKSVASVRSRWITCRAKAMATLSDILEAL